MGLLKAFRYPKESTKFKEKLKCNIVNDNQYIIKDGFFERNVLLSHVFSDKGYCDKIKIDNSKWEIRIYKLEDYIVVDFKNLDVNSKIYTHINAKIIFYIRSIYDFNCYTFKETSFQTFDTLHSLNEFNLIRLSDFYDNNYLSEYHEFIIGAYIRFYKYEKENFIKDIKIKQQKENNNVEVDDFYEFTIDINSVLEKGTFSKKFIICNQERVLKINTIKAQDISYLVTIHIKSSKYDKKYMKWKNIVYIRKCSDYSFYNCGECSPKEGITFKVNAMPSSSNYIFENNKLIIGVYHYYSYNYKDKFIDRVLRSVKNEQRTPESEGFFEWKMDNWDQLSNDKVYHSVFVIGNHRWKLELYPYGLGESNKDYISVRLKNVDDDIDESTHICIKKIIYFRNYGDYSCYQLKDDDLFSYYSKNYNASEHNILKQSDLIIKRGQNNKSIIENNRCIIGIYIRIYKEEQYINQLITSINNENRIIQENGFYEWKIENWNYLFYEEFSPIFEIGSSRWKLILYPKGEDNNQDVVTVKLQNINMKNRNELCAKVVFFMRNLSNNYFTMKGLPSFIYFTKDNDCYGTDIIEINPLISNNINKFFIENNKCIIGVYIRIYKNEKEQIIKSPIKKVENETTIEKSMSDIKKHASDLQQIENYEEILQKLKIYKDMIKKNEQREKELEEMKDYVKELQLNLNNNKKPKIETPTLVIATNDFFASEYDQLDIRKNEFLVVTNWDYEEGWVYGHRKNNEKEKGCFPKVFVKIYNESKKDDSLKLNYNCQVTPEYRIIFEQKLEKLRMLNDMKIIYKENKISINRNNIFGDSFNEIMQLSPYDMRKILRVRYIGEHGVDAGGLLRDFFYQLSKEIGNPNYALFQYSANNSYELEINPRSSIVSRLYLKYFTFIGRIMGLAIFNKQCLPLTFTLLFYKKLLGKAPEFSDLKDIDPDMYKNLNWLRENDGAENLYLTFEIEKTDCFGNRKLINLKPNGSNINVTDDNKFEYINLVVQHKLNDTSDEKQFEALRKGFYDVISKEISSILDEYDLKYLLSGINGIDVDDWEKNTVYEGYTEDDITIIFFWKCVRELDDEKKTQLLLFATGNSQVPVTGFKDLQGNGNIQLFKLKKTGFETDLPVSHTCFNRIDLPPYTSYTQLKQKLLRAITEGMTGFEKK